MRSLLVLMLSIAALSTPAHAQRSVGVVVTGDATVQPQLAAQLEDWLRQRGHLLVPSPLPSDAINMLIDCFVIEDLTCARKVVETQSKAPQMVFARIDLADSTTGMRDVTLTAYWFEKGADPTAVRRSCASCTDALMRTMTDELMTSLAGKGAAEAGQVALTTTPAGASVTIDGMPVGVTPLTYALPPGGHAIGISLAGHASAARAITIQRGETATLAVDLARVGPRKRKLPLLLLGAGGAVLLGGIIAYASSEEDTGEKPEYRDTKALGIGLGVVGLAAVGVGAYLLLRGDGTPEGPTVAVVPGYAYVGWRANF